MKDTSVSVIIPYSPAHTPARMLEEAKRSVRQQSVSTEIIVIKDTEQRGPAWARNQGLETAGTRFVSFLDADDLWLSGKLERQLDCIQETDSGISVEASYDDVEVFMRDLFVMNVSSITSSILINTKKVNVKFETKLERREDHLFILEAANQAGACFCSDLVKVRKHNGGLSSQNTAKLRIAQNKDFVEFVAQRVDPDLVTRYEHELYRKLYHSIGRSKHRRGEFRSAIKYLKKSLSYGFSFKTSGALTLSIAGYLSPSQNDSVIRNI